MSETTVSAKRAFEYQAAKFALYAPIGVIVFGLCFRIFLHKSTDPTTVILERIIRAVMGPVSLLLLIASVVMGIVALAGVARLGTKGLLWRAVTGGSLSVLILGAGLYGLLTIPITVRTAMRITGDWTSRVSAPGVGSAHALMSLANDGTARWQIVDGPRPVDFHGKWRVLRQKDAVPLVLRITFDATTTVGASQIDGMGWEIASVQGDRLELKAHDAGGKDVLEYYTRTK